MILSTSLSMIGKANELPAEEAYERIADAGYEAIDLPLCNYDFPGSPLLDRTWTDWAGRLGRRAGIRGVGFNQAHGPWGVIKDPADLDQRDRMLWLSKRCLHVAELLGIEWVVFHIETWRGPFDAAHLSAMRDFNRTMFTELAEEAERRGTGIALENSADHFSRAAGSARTYGSTPTELIELADLIGDRVGLCLDTGHAHLQGLDLREVITAYADRLACLHVNDNNGLADQHLLPFAGGIAWTDVTSALTEVGYRGPWTYEAEGSVRCLPDSLRDGAARLGVEIAHHLIGQGARPEPTTGGPSGE